LSSFAAVRSTRASVAQSARAAAETAARPTKFKQVLPAQGIEAHLFAALTASGQSTRAIATCTSSGLFTDLPAKLPSLKLQASLPLLSTEAQLDHRYPC
jgi:hypothetical protein